MVPIRLSLLIMPSVSELHVSKDDSGFRGGGIAFDKDSGPCTLPGLMASPRPATIDVAWLEEMGRRWE